MNFAPPETPNLNAGKAVETYVPVHGAAEIYVLDTAPETPKVEKPEGEAETDGSSGDGSKHAEITRIIIYVDGRSYIVDLTDEENAAALSPDGTPGKLINLKGKLHDPNGKEEELFLTLAIDPQKLKQALEKGALVPDDLKQQLFPQKMVVQATKMEQDPRDRGRGPGEDFLRMAFTDSVYEKTNLTHELEEVEEKEKPSKGMTKYSLVSEGTLTASLPEDSGSRSPIFGGKITGAALAAVAEIRGSLGNQFESLQCSMNDIGNNMVHGSKDIEQQRNQNFEKGTGHGMPGQPDKPA